MKMGKLLPYALIGGIFFLSKKKRKIPPDLAAATLASNAAIRTAAARAHQSAIGAKEEMAAQLRDIVHELAPSSVQGYSVGDANLIPPSDRVAPFSPKNPPLPFQFAVLYSISPDLAKHVTPESLWPTYAKGIVNNPTLLKIAEETSIEAKIINALALLSPHRQRMFAAKCAFRSAQVFGSELFDGTKAKQLATDAINTVRARADQKITAAQMEALNGPRIKQLKQISAVVGNPSYANLAIEAIEKASLTSAIATSAEEKRISHYLDMILSIEKSRAAHVTKALENARMTPKSTVKAPSGKLTPSVKKGATEAAEAAEKAARNAGRKFDAEFLEKLLRDL